MMLWHEEKGKYWVGVGILRYSGFSEILASDITPRYFAYSSSRCAAIIMLEYPNGVKCLDGMEQLWSVCSLVAWHSLVWS